jgi:hypothetical protein
LFFLPGEPSSDRKIRTGVGSECASPTLPRDIQIQSKPTGAIEPSLSRNEASLKRGNAGLLSPPAPMRQFKVDVAALRVHLWDIYSLISRIPSSSIFPKFDNARLTVHRMDDQ